jgi:hypothetical protein
MADLVDDDDFNADEEDLWNRTQDLINSSNASGSQSNNIVVVTRVRPFNQREKVANFLC